MDINERKNLTTRFDAEIGDEIAATVETWLAENFDENARAAVSDAVSLRLYQRLANREAVRLEKIAADKLRKAQAAVTALQR